MIVVDTNTIVYFFLNDPQTTKAEALFKRDTEWAAPRLWRSEFRNVLALYIRKKILSLEDALKSCQAADELLAPHELDVSSAQVLQLVSLSACSAYDCEFVAAAQQLRVPLITSDQKLVKAFPLTAVLLSTYVAG